MISIQNFALLVSTLCRLTGCAYCGEDFGATDLVSASPDMNLLDDIGQVHHLHCVHEQIESIHRQGGRIAPERAARYLARFPFTTIYGN